MPKKALKWTGIALGGLVGVIVIVLVVLYFIGGARINKTYDVQVASVAVSSEAEDIERARHLVEAVALCQECHGDSVLSVAALTVASGQWPGTGAVPSRTGSA